MFGKIEVICGPMFSGKSEELIKRLTKKQISGQSVRVYKPFLDLRTSNEIVSRSGYKLPAIVLTEEQLSDESFYYPQKLEAIGVKTVGIDEAQFFGRSIIDFVNTLQIYKIDIIISGLDIDFARRPFGHMPELLAKADEVTKLTAVCHNCGKDARYTFRKTDDISTVIIGDTDIYEAACGDCYVR